MSDAGNEDRIGHALAAAPVCLILCRVEDGRLRVVDANPRARLQLGAATARVDGGPLEEVFPDLGATEVPARLGEAGRAGSRWSTSGLKLETVHGPRDFEAHVFGDGLGHAGVLLLDSADRLLPDSTLRETSAQLPVTERLIAVGRLAGGLAHDFNNQLSAILGYAELIRRRLPADSPAIRFAESIAKAAERSADLNQQLLALARTESAQLVAVDLNRVVDAVVMLLNHSSDRRIVASKELSAQPAQVMGERGQLQGALVNLALQAGDAMPNGGELSFSTEIVELGAEARGIDGLTIPPGSYVRVRVRGTGHGMDDAARPRSLDPSSATQESGPAPGFGPPAVHGIVARHKGIVTVDGDPGKGPTYDLFLPRATSASEPTGATGARSRAPAHLRILLAEDEPLVLGAAVAMLESLGHEVTPCRDGRAAVEAFAERWRELDLVLLDMVMPEMSGSNVFDRIKAIDPKVKVLLSSGYTLDGEAQGLLARGAAGFVQKPYRIDELARAIARALA